MAEAQRVLAAVERKFSLSFQMTEARVAARPSMPTRGRCLPRPSAFARRVTPFYSALSAAQNGKRFLQTSSPSVLALLPIRKHFGLFANLRPAVCFAQLTHASPIRPISSPAASMCSVSANSRAACISASRSTPARKTNDVIAVDTMVYKRSEIERIAHVAFKAAQGRRKHLTSIDKANVLENSVLWRKTVNEIAPQYPDVKLSHLYVDNAAMQLIKNPCGFDVILAENLFGDILSDEMAMITGSLGMLPSASPRHEGNADGTLRIVRAERRHCAGYRRAGHREPNRANPQCRDDAPLRPRRTRRRGRHRRRRASRSSTWAYAPATSSAKARSASARARWVRQLPPRFSRPSPLQVSSFTNPISPPEFPLRLTIIPGVMPSMREQPYRGALEAGAFDAVTSCGVRGFVIHCQRNMLAVPALYTCSKSSVQAVITSASDLPGVEGRPTRRTWSTFLRKDT
jgi:isocitrate/isopropylmalate dehydrogenase